MVWFHLLSKGEHAIAAPRLSVKKSPCLHNLEP